MVDTTFTAPDLTTFRGLELVSVSGVARALGISWHTANDAIMERAEPTVLKDPHRLEGVEAIGVEEHLWRHTNKGSRYVTVIGLAPRAPGHRPSRLLEMVEGRSKRGAPGLARRTG